jgi:hypothetical protein
MSSLDRFPVKLADIGACPERFQASLRNAVDQSETINTLIYCPPYPSGRTSLPGSVLCLTDRQWVIVHDAKRSRPPIVKQALYDDTLFVELKIVLLYGCLKIHFAAIGDVRISPRTAAISRVPSTSSATPAAKKQKDLVRL